MTSADGQTSEGLDFQIGAASSEAQRDARFQTLADDWLEQRNGWRCYNAKLDDAGSGFVAAQYESLVGTIARSRETGQTVQRAATAIAALFSTGLGLTFAAQESPLPLRSVVPLLFLGLSVVLSTIYLAWLGGTSSDELEHEDPAQFDDLQTRREKYVVMFQRVAVDYVERRHEYLRAAVVALGIGLVLSPAPFIEVNTGSEAVPVQMAPWPTPPPLNATAGELLLYEAQLEETKTQRLVLLTRGSSDATLTIEWMPDWGWAAAVPIGLLVTWLGSFATLPTRKRQPEREESRKVHRSQTC